MITLLRVIWASFLETVPEDGTYLVRVSDDVLDPEDWPIHAILIKHGVVQEQRLVQNGVYGMEDMTEWSADDVRQWACEDNTGSHPCIEHNIVRLS
jgi:hypothetical protein